MKKYLNSLLNSSLFRVFFGLINLIIIFFFFRYIGIKGMLGFLVGMFIMAYLLLSNNFMIRMLVNQFSKDNEYIDMVRKGE